MLARLAFTAALLAPVAAGATDFQTVDKVTRNPNNLLIITGLPVGGNQAATVTLPSSDPSNSCEKYALLAMTHPGRYILTAISYPFTCTLSPQTP